MEKEKNLNKYGQSFQLGALGLFFKDKAFTSHIRSIIKSDYFDNKFTQDICKIGLDYLDKYHTFPSEDKVFDTLKSIIENSKGVSSKLYLNVLEEIKTADLSAIKYIKDEMEKFCFERYALIKVEEQITNIELGNYAAAKNAALNTYIPINTNYKELTFTKDFAILQEQEKTHQPIPSIFPTFNRISKGGPGAGDLAIVVAQSSFGKCFAKGTKIRMFDNSIKNIEDIYVGNKIMGWNGSSRTVDSLAKGREQMYEIQQQYGDNYTVNESHILCLRKGKSELFETDGKDFIKVKVKDYIKLSKSEKLKLKGIKKNFKHLSNYLYDSYPIKVIKKEVDEYFGFTLSDKDPDRMFLLEDYTVVHNTAYLTALARYLASQGKKVIYFSLETDRYQLLSRTVAGLVNIEQENLSQHANLIKQKIGEVIKINGEIKFFELKATTARIENLKLIVEEKKAAGYFTDIIIIDGLNQLKMPARMKSNDNNDRFEYLAEETRDWAKEEKIPIWMSFQTNRGGFNVEYADEQNIGKAIEVYQVCDWMLLFTQSIPMYEMGECYVQLLKNRLGRKGVTLLVKYDPNKGTFEEIKEIQRTVLMDKKQIKEVRQGIDHARSLIKEKTNNK